MLGKIRQGYILVRYVDVKGLCKVRQERAMEARGPDKPFHVHIKLGLSHADAVRKNDYFTISLQYAFIATLCTTGILPIRPRFP